MMEVEDFIANQEIITAHLCENLNIIISLNWTRKTLQVTKTIRYSGRINLTEENDSLLANCEEVAKELNNFFANAVKNHVISQIKKIMILWQKTMILL